MPTSEREKKLTQFNAFFSINHSFNVNVAVIDNQSLPSFEQFMQKMPLPFKIASDIVHIDQAALRPLQGISSNAAGQLIEYLHHQTQKIDLLIGYIIGQQDLKEQRFHGINFGGGGLIFNSNQLLKLGQMLELKIFLENNSTAVYCMGEVIDTDTTNNEVTPIKSETYQVKVIFHYIKEDDREILVRTSLHEQSKQLQVLAKNRIMEIDN
tara:strand:+ start:378 stop:1007 length:630 start_codon:yes stop_codon:yes gene_type:complete